MTDWTPVKVTTGEEIERDAIDFDLVDRKGRKIGYRWSIRPESYCTYAEGETVPQYYCGLTKDRLDLLGDNFLVSFSVTRNGRDYGAGHRDHYKTIEAARAGVRKKAEAARRRYAAKPQEKR